MAKKPTPPSQADLKRAQAQRAAEDRYHHAALLEAFLTGMSLALNPRDDRSDVVTRLLRDARQRITFGCE